MEKNIYKKITINTEMLKHGWDFTATAGFKDSDISESNKKREVFFRCILSAISHLSGFEL